MSRIVESLKRLCRVEPTENELERQLTALSGLPVLHERNRAADDLIYWARLEPLIERRDFAGLAEICGKEVAAKARFENGRSRSELAFNALLAPIDQADGDSQSCEDELAAYEAWWQQDRRNPAAAGIYAVALASTGFAYRGMEWAENVSESQWALLRDFSNRAEAVLDRASADRDRCWIWNFANLRASFIAYGIGEAPASATRKAFEATMLLDPEEVSVYEERVNHLLPRWGGSFEDLELLARQTYATTRQRLGAEMYARIYDTIVKWEEPSDTLIDYHLLREGFRDWLARTPSQPLANRFAAHAHAAGDIATVRDLFECHIHEVHPYVWFGPKQPLMAWQACTKAASRT